MVTKRSEEVNFEVAIQDGELERYFVCRANVYFITDEAYGQDEDGNRGQEQDILEKKEIFDVIEVSNDGEEHDWDFEKLQPKIQEALLEAIPIEGL